MLNEPLFVIFRLEKYKTHSCYCRLFHARAKVRVSGPVAVLTLPVCAASGRPDGRAARIPIHLIAACGWTHGHPILETQ
jgi:hypothetical protein